MDSLSAENCINFQSVKESGLPESRISPPSVNLFEPRARRYSASFSSSFNGTVGPRLTPRINQLKQEECIDINVREVKHEKEIHSAMQMSQSWEDLTLFAENSACKSEDLNSNHQFSHKTNSIKRTRQCLSPSPTSRIGMRVGLLSPSPTRRTFATRRSMSPIAMRPSQLGPVKRKFDLEDQNWNSNYSPPPIKKIFSNIIDSHIISLPSINSNLNSETMALLSTKSNTNSFELHQDISSQCSFNGSINKVSKEKYQKDVENGVNENLNDKNICSIQYDLDDRKIGSNFRTKFIVTPKFEIESSMLCSKSDKINSSLGKVSKSNNTK